jgi:hypothetical protein
MYSYNAMLLRVAIHGNYHRIDGNNNINVYPLPIAPFFMCMQEKKQ